MKIDYVSDLHLDFHVKENHNLIKYKANTIQFLESLLPENKGEVFILAGDISHDVKQSVWILEFFSQHYKQVFYTLGNHDYYLVSGNEEKKYGDSKGKVAKLLESVAHLDNVKLLLNYNVEEYKGITFSGSTNWYDLTDAETHVFFHANMNDSQLIKGYDIQTEAYKEYESYEKLQNVDVMVTHVPPIIIDSHHRHGSTKCYMNKVNELKAKHWVFGHCHEQNVYDEYDMKFYINSLGYPCEFLNHVNHLDYTKGNIEILKSICYKIKSFKL